MKIERYIRTLLAILATVCLFPASHAAAETVRLANRYIAVDFDTVSGRYMVRTAAGDPDLLSDDNLNLTGDFFNSSVIIKLDNQYYRFGDMSGQVLRSSAKGDTAEFVWTLKGMEITQEIRLTNGSFSPVPSFAKVRYWFRNTDKTYHYAGLRVILDTMLGLNDDSAILSPPSGLVDREREFSFDSVPDFWTAWDSIATPAGRILMGFADHGVVKPDYLTFASRKRLSDTKWDFKADPAKDFRVSPVEPPDTAVSMKWESIPFRPGYENGVAFLYGVAKAAASDRMPPLDLLALAPQRTGSGSFWVLGEARNSDVSKSVKNLKLKLELPAGLSLAQGEAEIVFPELKPGEKRAVYWKVSVGQKGRYSLKATAVGTAGSMVINQVNFGIDCE